MTRYAALEEANRRADKLVRKALDAIESCPNECGHGIGMHSLNGCYHKDGHDRYCDCSYIPTSVANGRRVGIVAAMSCKTHPRYQAIRPPRSACEACWRLYIEVHP